MTDFPLPGAATPVVVAPAPGRGPQFWTGAPSAVLDGDTIVLGYRTRTGPDTADETVIAVSDDGERYETVLVLPQEHFGAQWTERPALARTETGWGPCWRARPAPGRSAARGSPPCYPTAAPR